MKQNQNQKRGIVAAICVLALAALPAEEAAGSIFSHVQPEVGLTGLQETGIASTWGADVADGRDAMNFGGGFGLLGHVSFGTGTVRYMNQIEVNLLFNAGMGNDLPNLFAPRADSTAAAVTLLDIPLLFGVDIDAGGLFTLTPYLGPYLSIPLGGTLTVQGTGHQLGTCGVQAGGIAGFTAGLHLGPGALIADARFAFDFMPTVMNVEGLSDAKELYHRAGVQASIGYRMRIGG